ncbi:hypothetical protein B566_EDAN001950 [Ephemera danica]|nr:hypothetical protein B566_EDAN001950 [Ephemera danica]
MKRRAAAMIELTAKLLRGPVYLSGESVECSVTFRNPSPPEHTRSQSNSSQKDAATPEDLASSNADTSYAPCRGERGEMVLATKPKILFCDLRLSTGESKSFLYSEVLPSEAPPSFRGQSVKYSYKLTVGVQRVNMPIRLLRVPLRVLVIQGLAEPCLYGENEELTPSNPFLENQQKESALDVALQELQNITARRSPNFYNITNSRGKVVRFCLFKQAYKLGEDIVGTFDFSDAAVACMQLSVALQSEEEVAPGHRRHPNQQAAVVVYSKAHEVCLGLLHSHLSLPIPLYLAPTFSTGLVSLKWRLHFEFVTSLEPNPDLNCVPEITNGNSATWQGPSSIPIETMVWDLPVTIYPSNPQLVSQGIRAQCKHNMLF